MNYTECIENARPRLGKYCKACPECNGRACKNRCPVPAQRASETQPYATMTNGNKSV